MKLKTRSQAKAELTADGESISSWALTQGFPPAIVLGILNDNEDAPRYKCLRGHSHRIAIALGIKAAPANLKAAA